MEGVASESVSNMLNKSSCVLTVLGLLSTGLGFSTTMVDDSADLLAVNISRRSSWVPCRFRGDGWGVAFGVAAGVMAVVVALGVEAGALKNPFSCFFSGA